MTDTALKDTGLKDTVLMGTVLAASADPVVKGSRVTGNTLSVSALGTAVFVGR